MNADLYVDKSWAGVQYRMQSVHDRAEGWSAVELLRREGTSWARVACLTYWDAQGQFALEMSANELPLTIIEALIAEAKSRIST